MLVAIDIGNSRASCGLFIGRRLKKSGFIEYPARPSAHAFARMIEAFAGCRDFDACISSVLPRLTRPFAAACSNLTGRGPVVVTPRNAGVRIRGYDRRQLGVDRLLAASAAYHRHRCAVIVVDAGTAVTIDLVSRRGEFAGGVIIPGIEASARRLGEIAARLPYARPAPARRVVAKNTREAMRAGLFFGYAGMIGHIIERMKRESGARPLVVATGGDAALIRRACPQIAMVHPHLVIEGLMLAWHGRAKKLTRRG